MFTIKQLTNDDCGFACLKTLLANLYKKKEYLYIPQDENHGPYSYKDIITIAQEYGVTLEGIKCEGEDIKLFNEYPALVSISKDEDTLHMVYLYKVGKYFVYYFDPDEGVVMKSKKAFLDEWDNTALIVKTYEEKEVKNYGVDFSIKDRLISAFFQILSLGFMVLGFVYIDKESLIAIPIIAFLLSLITSGGLQIYLVSAMKKMDEKYINDLEHDVKDRKAFLYRFAQFKKSLFTSPIGLLSDGITAILLSVIMAINGITNLLIPLVSTILLTADITIIRPRLKNKSRVIGRLESFKQIDNLDDFKDNLYQINDLSYEYVRYEGMLRYFKYIIILLTVMLVMTISQINSMAFVLTYFIFGITIFEKSNSAANYFSNIGEVKTNKARFINSMNNK